MILYNLLLSILIVLFIGQITNLVQFNIHKQSENYVCTLICMAMNLYIILTLLGMNHAS